MYQPGMAKATRDSSYWQGRLAREHPAIAERLRSGEIPTVRAAAIEAGLIRERTPLADLRRAWAKAAPEQRQAFVAEVGLPGPPVVDHDRLAKMSRDELLAESKRIEEEGKAISAELWRRHDEAEARYRAKTDARDQQITEAVQKRMVERRMKTRSAAKQIGISEDELAMVTGDRHLGQISRRYERDPIRKKLLTWLG